MDMLNYCSLPGLVTCGRYKTFTRTPIPLSCFIVLQNWTTVCVLINRKLWFDVKVKTNYSSIQLSTSIKLKITDYPLKVNMVLVSLWSPRQQTLVDWGLDFDFTSPLGLMFEVFVLLGSKRSPKSTASFLHAFVYKSILLLATTP